MSKKKLLEESTIRSFMKLANLQPLTSKFLAESEHEEEKSEDKEDSEEEGDDDEEELKEEVSEDGDVKEEAKEPAKSSGKTLTKTTPEKGFSGAKSVKDPGGLKAAAKTHNHTATGTNIAPSEEVGGKSNVSKKNNSQHEVVTENTDGLGEVEMATEAEDEMTGSDDAGETEQHQESVKDAIQKILGAVSQIAQEYGVEMDVQSGEEVAPESPEVPSDMAPEAPGAEDEKMMEEKLDQMVEKLTKRVAARLVKETKAKKR